MKHSIRTFLLINLLISVFSFTSLTVITHYFFDSKKINQYSDQQLTLSASLAKTLLSQHKQHSSDTSKPTTLTCSDLANQCGKVNLQVWDKNGQLIVSLPNNLKQPFAKIANFSDQKIDNINWRVFVTTNDSTGLTVAVAERYNKRHVLKKEIILYTTTIILFCLFLLAILIWFIVGNALKSIQTITNSLKYRAPASLTKLKTETAPKEVQPLVEELNILFQKLQEAFVREERFSSDAAHELRTPLAALRAHVHVALNATSKEECDRSLHKIITGIDRSTHVINQLLILARTTKIKSLISKLEPVSLNKEAQIVIADLVPIAQKKNIEIELIDKSKKQKIMGDPITINVLIRNLIDNAIRYIDHNHGLISVIIESAPKHVILKVIDNGPGIPKDLREAVFERFFRIADNNIQGSGLGLNIVKQVLQQHNANIKLNVPKSGHGLEVVVSFKKPTEKELARQV
ncbi:MAG: hypothetical protein A2X78_00710 [Gammaproteobacteria bacterium GWE2_37_16]|nr:MAG: hypothetical protein A2X78_00710 [Gammaproteobacteria bacterium GWE2_37_16]